MEVISYLLGSVEIIVFAWGIVQMEFHKNKVRMAIGGLITIAADLFWIYCPNVSLGVLVGGIAVPVIGHVLLFDARVLKSIVQYEFCSSYVGFIYLPLNILFTVCEPILKFGGNNDIRDCVRSILAISIILCLSYFLKKKKDIVAWIKELPTGYFCIAWICALTVNGINSYSDSIMEDAGRRVRIVFESLEMVLTIFIYTLGIGFALADFLRKRYRNENIIKDRYLSMSKEHYNGLVVHMQEIRRLKHDMQAHINIINKYANDGNLSLLKEYVGELAEHHALQMHGMINTNNELVDAIIMDGIGKSSSKGIIIECMGEFADDLNISDFDLCTMFSNLLSNSIEACEKIKNSEKKINIILKNTNDEMRIIFENPVEEDIDFKKLGGYTSKKDKRNHGFGIGSIQKTVEKYDGNIVMGIDNGKFRTVIVFYR